MERPRKICPNRVPDAANLRIAGSNEACQLPLICPAMRQNHNSPLAIASGAAAPNNMRMALADGSGRPARRNNVA